MLISTPHSMLTWHSHNTLCSPGISPITPHAHLAHLSHPMLTFTHHHIHSAFLYYALWFPAYESTITETFEMSPNLLSGLTPEIPLQINLQITPRPDSEASHKTYLSCQPRHMYHVGAQFKTHGTHQNYRIYVPLQVFLLSSAPHSLCAHSTCLRIILPWPHTSNFPKCFGQPLFQCLLTLELWPYPWGGNVNWNYPYIQNFSQIGPAVTEL